MRTTAILAMILVLPVFSAGAVDVDEALDGLSLGHKIDQMHMIGNDGRELSEP